MDRPNLKGTQTEINLMKAFSGESQARNRYTMYASIAKKEGYEQIAEIFEITANNEREHAKIYYNYLQDSPIEITAAYPYCIGSTYDNLLCGVNTEHDEGYNLYPAYGDTADEEGFYDIGQIFRNIASIERHHDERYQKLAENIKEGIVFSRQEESYWICRKCGFIHLGLNALEICPVCKHPKGFFELICHNY